MYIVSDSLLCDKYIRLSNETVEWLIQQPDQYQATSSLVASIRRLEEYYLKRKLEEKALLDEEQLYRLDEKPINQQKQLHAQINKAGIFQQLQNENNKLTEQLEIVQEQVKTLQIQLQEQDN